MDSNGNVYVTGASNAFKITADGVISEIIDVSGDGDGNNLEGPRGITVDSNGIVYVTGAFSANAFMIRTSIIESIPLEAGWNLISTSQQSLMVTNPNLSDRIWTWNAQEKRFETLTNGAAMNSIRGYWIYASNETILELVED